MPSKVEIANRALIRLGVDTITSFTESTEPARKINAVWDTCLEELLSEKDWNFATRWAVLSRLDETPSNGYSYAYQLPTDPKCLKVVKMDNDNENYAVENGKLYTNNSVAKIKYVAKIDDAGNFPAWFAKALSMKLAYETAYALTGKHSREREMLEEYQAALDNAMGADAQEGTPEYFDETEVVRVRGDVLGDVFKR